MDLNLFSLPVVLVLCVIVTGSFVFLGTQLDRAWYLRRLPLLLVMTLLFAVVGQVGIARLTNSPSELPPYFALIEMPFTLSISLTLLLVIERFTVLRKFEEEFIITPQSKSHKEKYRSAHGIKPYLVTAVLLVSSLLFGLSLVNRFYRYYPTLGSVFGRVSASKLSNQQLIRANYADKASRIHAPQSTIQGAIDNLHKTASGKVFGVTIPGAVSGFKARTAWVYEPPIALTNANVALPVLILLPGTPGQTSDWITSIDFVNAANMFAKTHDGITPLIVVADDNGGLLADTECVNGPQGNVETYLTTDVPQYIKSHFIVSRNPAQWAIGGYSMGGTCSIMLALRHPNTYDYFMDLSGEAGPELGTKAQTINTLFHNSTTAWDAHQPSLLLQKHTARTTYKNMGGFFADGTQDATAVTTAQRHLYTLAKADDLDVVSETRSGEHTFALWKRTFVDALPWLSNQLDATVCQTACRGAVTVPNTANH